MRYLLSSDVDEALDSFGGILDQFFPLACAVWIRLLALIDDECVLNLLDGLLLGSVSQDPINSLSSILDQSICSGNSVLRPDLNKRTWLNYRLREGLKQLRLLLLLLVLLILFGLDYGRNGFEICHQFCISFRGDLVFENALLFIESFLGVGLDVLSDVFGPADYSVNLI